MLSGARTGSYRDHWATSESALRFLEKLPAPEIVATETVSGTPYRISVPNNDSDKAGREWSAGRPFDPASIRTMKLVVPREMANPNNGCGRHVYYLWKLPAEQESVLIAIRRLASFLHTFGWGTDMAFADFLVFDGGQRQELLSNQHFSVHLPGQGGALQSVPITGYLEDLLSAYVRSCSRMSKGGVDPAIRATRYGQQRYQRRGLAGAPVARFLLRQLNDSEKWFSTPWALGLKVAAWMRHRTANALREEGYPEGFINGYVLGHGEGHDRHISFVPIPTIRQTNADGAIRRVMVVEPPDADGSISHFLQWKLTPSDLWMLQNGGTRRPVCSLTEAPENDLVLPRYLDVRAVWRSVTPVVLHGYNSEHRKFSLKKTEQLLLQAFEKSGYSRESIAELSFQAAPFWAGTEGAMAIRVPEHLRQWPRYHATVRFHNPVAGPVLAGIGRHYGIGLFAAPLQ